MSHATHIHAMAGHVALVLKLWDPSLDDLCSVFALLLAEHCEIISHARIEGLTMATSSAYRDAAATRVAERIELFSVACAESWRLREQAKAIDPTNTGECNAPDVGPERDENVQEAEDVSVRLIAQTGARQPRKPG